MKFRSVTRFEAVRFVGGRCPSELTQEVADGVVRLEDDGRMRILTSVASLNDSAIYANPGDWILIGPARRGLFSMRSEVFAARFEPVDQIGPAFDGKLPCDHICDWCAQRAAEIEAAAASGQTLDQWQANLLNRIS